MPLERYQSPPFQDAAIPVAKETLNPRDLFARLPIAENANLDQITPLIPENIDKNELRFQVENRFLDFINLRKSNGQYDIPKITNELAFALLDSIQFDLARQEVAAEGEIIETGRHEAGHYLTAYNLRWFRNYATAVPEGRSLGSTLNIPPSNLSFEDMLLERASISLGGKVAAQMSGDKPHGIGSDMDHAQKMAVIAVSLPNARFSSVAAFFSEAETITHRALKSFGPSLINSQAIYLASKGTIT